MAKAKKQTIDESKPLPLVVAEANLDAVLAFRRGLYRHYKGGIYDAVDLVRHHDTGLAWVLYRSREHGTLNVRPLMSHQRLVVSTQEEASAWNDTVMAEDTGYEVPRFEFLAPPAERSAV